MRPQLLSPLTHTPTVCGLPGMGSGFFKRWAVYSPTTCGTSPSRLSSSSRHAPFSASFIACLQINPDEIELYVDLFLVGGVFHAAHLLDAVARILVASWQSERRVRD